MMSIGHSKVFDAIKYKCWEHGSKFLHVDEAYTSQTCPNCGKLHKTSSETYSCPACGYTQDAQLKIIEKTRFFDDFYRDMVGALNMLLKALS